MYSHRLWAHQQRILRTHHQRNVHVRQVQSIFFGISPHNYGEADFEVLAAGWERTGRSVNAFQALVIERWAEWEVGKSRMEGKRVDEERKREEQRADLRRWLDELGLAEYSAQLMLEDFDIDSLQHL